MKYFLFAPHLTCGHVGKLCTIAVCDAHVTYENGAVVSTSFVSNLYDRNIVMTTEPQLLEAIDKADKENNRGKQVAKVKHPNNIICPSLMGKFVTEPWTLTRDQCIIKAHPDNYKAFYGTAYLISERAAAERAAAVVPNTYDLSKEELEQIIAMNSR